MKEGVLHFIKDKTRMVACMTLLASIAGFLAGWNWVLELTCHFRMQYLATCLASAVVLLIFRDYRWSAVAFAGVLLNGMVILPWFFGGSPRASGAPSSTVRVMLSNVFTANRNSGALIELIRAESPDVLVLQEVNERWIEELQPLAELLPHGLAIPRSDNFGILLWSRMPLTRIAEISLSDSEVPSVFATLEWSGKPLSLLATHPVPPGRKAGSLERNVHLRNVAQFARESATPLVLLGDLNVTMFSPYHSELVRDSRLRNARKGFGILPTWPTFFSLLAIPLDHCLVSSTITVTAIRTGADIGSDHLPVIVDLAPP